MMKTKILTIVGVAAVTVIAAGTAAFVAVRQSQVPASSVQTEELAAPAPESEGVTETEELLTPEEIKEAAPALRSAPAERPAPRTASVRPSEPTNPADVGVVAERRPRPPVQRTEPPPVIEEPDTVASRLPLPPAWTPGPIDLPESASIEPELLPAPPPPLPEFEEVVLPADSVIGLQIENSVSSETARIEDRVDARVTRDVRAGGLVAVPAGSRVQGSVTLVEQGGKIKERARLGVRFHTLVLADGTRVPIQTETILREGDSPAGESAAKIGGAAVGGAILGAILGGGKGAAIGGSVGAAGGAAATMAGSRNPATLQSGSTVTARLSTPTTVTVEKPAGPDAP